MSVLDLDDAKTYLSVTEAGTDEEIQAVIDAAESAIGARIGPLEVTSVTRRVHASGDALVLTVLPAVSLSSVTYVGGSALTLGDLYLDTASGVVTYNSQTSRFAQGWYTVVYNAGYAGLPDGLPAGLMLAIKELVRHLWSPKRGSGNARPRPQGDVANVLPGAAYTFPIRVEQLLSPYLSLGFA